MPPKRDVPDDPPGMPISLRLKYGVHTIFLLIDPLTTFAELGTELVSVLQDRHPDGLRPGLEDLPTPVPAHDTDYHIAYGVLKDPHDDSKGWRDLRIEGHETLVSKGLRNNDIVAFLVRDPEDADQTPEFVVKFPRLDGDEEEDEDELADGMDEDDDEEP